MAKHSDTPVVANLKLREFFSSDYIVPRYQRNYAWGETQVQQLMEDLFDFFDGGDTHYLLGQVIVAESEETGFEGVYELIDGQQRASTLVILFAVLYKHLTALGAEQDDTHDLYGCFRRSKTSLRVELSGGANTTVLQYLTNPLDSDAVSRATKSQMFVVGAIETIETELEERKMLGDLTGLLKFADRVLRSVYISRQSISDSEQANDFFERVNNRGLPLSSADRLKNKLLQPLQDEEYDIASRMWSSSEENIRSHGREGTLEFLLAQMLRGRVGVRVKEKDLYSSWRPYVSTADGCLELIEDIERKSVFLDSLLDSGSNVDIWSDGTRYFKFVQNIGVKLAGSHLWAESFEFLCRRLESIAMLSLLAGGRPQDYDTRAASWAKNVAALRVDASYEEVLEATRIEQEQIDVWVADARTKIDRLRYGKTDGQNKRLRYVLARVAYELNLKAPHGNFRVRDYLETTRKARGRSTKIFEGFDIEHVSPRSLETGLGDLVDSLGNLALLHYSDNRSKGASEIVDKVLEYSDSVVYSTRSLTSVTQSDRIEAVVSSVRVAVIDDLSPWDADSIERRFKMYVDVLIDSLLSDLT